jgi:NADPH:quinone reductase-like Zn-dependent oxidoreductase
LFNTPDMIEQHRLLNEVAGLVEAGRIRSTMTRNLGKLSAATLKQAHALVESGGMIGKVVLDGF